ncbi:MAG: alkaline phosphatase family protein [Clostridia bacterium]|nr:alkaline phosphatase family protein [Clostridia bacterium]
MKSKVILISIDGMRPDGFLACGHPFIHDMMAHSMYTLSASSMQPSVTLPCHMSMFTSVPPERHGTVTNTYTPPVRPVKGLCEQIHDAGGRCAMFYGWEPMRDIARPGSMIRTEYLWCYARESADTELTARALACLREDAPDFLFLYLVDTDDKGGHDCGWMSEAYLSRIRTAIECVKNVLELAGEDYTVIVTADHGGHDRTHGTTMPEDMTIPMFFIGKPFEPAKQFDGGSLLDLAPTIAAVMGVLPVYDWEGNNLAR